MRRVWNKFSQAEISRFVMTDAIGLVRLDLDREALLRHSDGRRQLAGEIYRRVAAQDVHYAFERYQPDAREQEIRSPFEVLAAPREGTCLDLAAVFAGLCLGFDLIPVLVVTDRHALCLVSLGHPARNWQEFDRPEYDFFKNGVVTDAPRLRELVDSGGYAAVECTGFARSTTLPESSIEGSGRVDGRLSFEQALIAGRRQLEAPIQFAIDLSVAQHGLGIMPFALPPDQQLATERYVATLVAGGVQLDRRAAPLPEIRPLPRPVAPLIRPNRVFVDRVDQLTALRTATGGQPIWIAGPAGIGKSAVLRQLCHDDRDHLARYPDGVVALTAIDDGRDGIVELHTAFHDVPHGVAASRTQMARDLQAVTALVTVDEASSGVADQLADAVPASTIVVVDRDGRAYGAGYELGELPLTDAIELFRSECGPAAATADPTDVADAVERVGGQPTELVAAARLVAGGTTTIAKLAAGEPTRPSTRRRDDLGTVERQIVELLELAGERGIHRQLLAQLVAGEIDAALRDLLARHMVTTGSPRYRLVERTTALPPPGEVDRRRREIVSRWAHWIRSADPEEVAQSLPELTMAFWWAFDAADHHATVALGRGLDAALVLTRRWGTWERVLLATRVAAHAVGDIATVAHSMHQLGARRALDGDRKAARALFEEALTLRLSLENEAAAVTRHNLRLVHRSPIGWLRGAGAAVGGILLLGIFAVGNQMATQSPPDTTPVATTATIPPTTDPGTSQGTTEQPVETTASTSPPTTTATSTTTEAPLIEITLDPTAADLGRIAVGERDEISVRLVNGGNRAIDVTGFSSDAADFEVANVDCAVVDPGGSCGFVVSFAPSDAGPQEATISIGGVPTEGGDRFDAVLPTTGEGFRPAEFAAEQAVLDLGVVAARLPGGDIELAFAPRVAVPADPVTTASLTLQNIGTDSGSLTAAVTDSTGWTVVDNRCADEVPGGETCTIEVGFGIERDPATSTDVLDHPSRLTLTSEIGREQTIDLIARSAFQQPDLVIAISHVSLAAVAGAWDVAVEVEVRNLGLTGAPAGIQITTDSRIDRLGVWSGLGVFDTTTEPLPGLGSVVIRNTVSVPLTFADGDDVISIRVEVDDCQSEFDDVCAVDELDEDNNLSPAVVVGTVPRVNEP